MARYLQSNLSGMATSDAYRAKTRAIMADRQSGAVLHWSGRHHDGESLSAHLDNGTIKIHTNETVQDLRDVGDRSQEMGLASATERSGQVAGRLYSLVVSCKLAKIKVKAHLEEVLTRVSTTPSSRVAELTPCGWAEARAAELLSGSA